MEVTLESENKLLRFVNIYRPPYSKKNRFTIAHFIEEFEKYLDALRSKNGTPILVGDFNIHIEKPTDCNTKRFLNLLAEFELCQIVPPVPTHTAGGTLDHIITDPKMKMDISTPTIVKLGTNSDHYFVRAEINQFISHSTNVNNRSKLIEYRKFKEIHVELFRSDLKKTGIMTQSYQSVDEAVTFLQSTLSVIIDKHCPVIKRKIRIKHPGANWFDVDLRNLRSKRRAVERMKRKNPSDENKTAYVKICQAFEKLVKFKKKNFYQKSLQSSKNDMRSLYKKIKKLQGEEEPPLPKCVDDAKLAEDFKNFFSDKVSAIREKIESERTSSGIENSYLNNMNVDCKFEHFSLLTKDDLNSLVKNMPDKFCSLDPIPTWLLKKCLPELSPILVYIVNESLASGYFPKDLKHAILNPTLKNSNLDHDLLNSYRPISNISFISKILEKCALKQISEYLECNQLINDAQSGYRAHHSCETLLVRMFDDINGCMEQNKAVALMLLDLSAAFDTIDHNILLEKLEIDYGIGANVLKWIFSYLENRSFSVKINNSTSGRILLLFGVPQGSLLGPILFILYTKDLKKIAEKYGLTIQLYADDSQLYISFDVKNIVDTSEKLQLIKDCLNEMKKWMLQNFMQLNESKTQFAVLGKKSVLKNCDDISLEFNSSSITQSDFKNDSVKSLGVKLDSDLSMLRQISDIKMKCFWTLSNLRTFSHYLDEDLKITLVKTLIISKIDYCNALYAGCNQYAIKKLQSTMDYAVRFIYNITDWSKDLTPFYKKAHILPIAFRIKYKICLLVHKALDGSSPEYIRNLLYLYHDEPSKQSLRSFSDKRLLLRPSTQESKITRKMFSYHAPIFWNELPFNLRHNKDTDKFKRDLKTHYFQFI